MSKASELIESQVDEVVSSTKILLAKADTVSEKLMELSDGFKRLADVEASPKKKKGLMEAAAIAKDASRFNDRLKKQV